MEKYTFDVKITEHIGEISRSGGYSKQLNKCAFNGREPKWDIRTWDTINNKPLKGLTLTGAELLTLYGLLRELFEEGDGDAK